MQAPLPLRELCTDLGILSTLFRVVGSKIQLAGWSSYSALLWTLKASLLFFYIRLTVSWPVGAISPAKARLDSSGTDCLSRLAWTAHTLSVFVSALSFSLSAISLVP
jgi:hypothetical protein